MIGVIVFPGPDEAAYGLAEQMPLSLLPLGDRPVIQHMIEFLAHQGVRQFELILEHSPEQVEQYLGDGTRWGCRFRYHLVSQPGRGYRLLSVIAGLEKEAWLLAHADQLPYIPLADYFNETQPVAFFDGEAGGWTGTAIFPAGRIDDAVMQGSRAGLDAHVAALIAGKAGRVVQVPKSISVKTPAALLQTQRDLLDRTFADLMIGGNENERGVWISRNVVIHPSAHITPPVYLGPNCRLGKGAQIGPYAVISGNCIVDAHTTVEDSLITSGSYVGEHLELRDSIVSRNLLVNARLETGVSIQESFLLGNLADSPHRSWLGAAAEALAAIFLIVLLSPLILLLALYAAIARRVEFAVAEIVQTPASGNSQSWTTYRLPFVSAAPWSACAPGGWKSLFTRFLPGLFAVARGKISLVGLPPRTREEVNGLPKDWQSLYLNGKAGLITEATVLEQEHGMAPDAYLTEACYCATRNWKHDLGLFARYVFSLFVRPHFEAGVQGQSPAD